jgi:hypothetical protein
VSIIPRHRINQLIFNPRPPLNLAAPADFLKLSLGPETIGKDVLGQIRDHRVPVELFFESEEVETGVIWSSCGRRFCRYGCR